MERKAVGHVKLPLNMEGIGFLKLLPTTVGDRGSTVVKVLCYKS